MFSFFERTSPRRISHFPSGGSLSSDNVVGGNTGTNIIPVLSMPSTFLNSVKLEGVTHVINCAAVASFSNNPMINRVNVDGTFEFAPKMNELNNLQCFLHVGTAMSCTPEPDTLVVENDSFSHNAEHLVEYTRSKSTIEQLMRKYLPEMPLIIARPSIVVGHSEYGCLPSSSIFWVFRMGVMLKKFMCSLEDKIDVVPVDYCADSLLMLMESDHQNGEIFHISAGEDFSVRFSDIDITMAKALGTSPVAEQYTQVDYEELVKMRHQFQSIFWSL